jgi:hypothetical protein
MRFPRGFTKSFDEEPSDAHLSVSNRVWALTEPRQEALRFPRNCRIEKKVGDNVPHLSPRWVSSAKAAAVERVPGLIILLVRMRATRAENAAGMG